MVLKRLFLAKRTAGTKIQIHENICYAPKGRGPMEKCSYKSSLGLDVANKSNLFFHRQQNPWKVLAQD